MNLNQLYYFKTIARLQHFTRAANELNISQPTLSYAMTTLEQELGTYLFEKQGRNVSLTKYGKVFLDHVERSLDELELGIRSIKKLTSAQEGRIDLGYVDPLAPRYIPKLVRSFLTAPSNEEIRFTYYQGVTKTLLQGLKMERYDVVFCSKEEEEEAIEFYPVLQQDLILAVPPSHPLSAKASINIEDIIDYPLVAYTRSSGLGKLTFHIFDSLKLKPNIISEAYNEMALYGLVSEGLAISMVAYTPEILNYNIKVIPIDNPLCKRNIYMAYMKDKYLSPAVNKFISFVKKAQIQI